ncbi:MAG: hypothetical protein E7447_06040 [Ruminococcaceae bacterium]|nr:hypothetical protein [Oscillospiraceae bacterium]
MLKRNLSSMAMSLVEVIIGILLLVNPIGFTSGIIIAFGIVLMVMGISLIMEAVFDMIGSIIGHR